MLYSVFRAGRGVYDYYETPEQHAINADLPVPSLPLETNRVGVPAIEAARRLPAGARPVGSGWHARGVVASDEVGLGLGDLKGALTNPWAWVALGLGAFLLYREAK